MELNFISDEAYTQLMKRLDKIERHLSKQLINEPLDEIWLDTRQVCTLLSITGRTLQAYRDRRTIPYSHMSGKIYYKASDIKKHLNENYDK